jgi:hypothetical protein
MNVELSRCPLGLAIVVQSHPQGGNQLRPTNLVMGKHGTQNTFDQPTQHGRVRGKPHRIVTFLGKAHQRQLPHEGALQGPQSLSSSDCKSRSDVERATDPRTDPVDRFAHEQRSGSSWTSA